MSDPYRSELKKPSKYWFYQGHSFIDLSQVTSVLFNEKSGFIIYRNTNEFSVTTALKLPPQRARKPWTEAQNE